MIYNKNTRQVETFSSVAARVIEKLEAAPITIPALVNEFPEYDEESLYAVIAYLHKKRRIKIISRRIYLK